MAGKSQRIYIRLEPKTKRYLEQVAATNNRSLSDFIITGAMTFAEDMAEQATGEVLSEQEWNELQLSMIRPPKSYKALQRAFREYR